MELSENLKLRLETLPGESQQDRLARSADNASPEAGQNDDAESAMRKALGLLGEGSRHRPDPERSDQSPRGLSDRGMGDRFNGGLHRRRFVQDGDVPVTVLRRDQGHDLPAHRAAAPVTIPTTSRLQRTEAALAAETAAREKAERSLSETQNIVRDLQTKIGHAELTKTEAIETLRRERESIAQIRAEANAADERLHELQEQLRIAEASAASYQDQLSDERQARRLAEKALRTAEAARDAAQQLVRTLSEERPEPIPEPVRFHEPARARELAHKAPGPVQIAPPPRRPRVMPEPEIIEALPKRRRAQAAVEPEVEPEPVKWWLNTGKPSAKRK